GELIHMVPASRGSSDSAARDTSWQPRDYHDARLEKIRERIIHVVLSHGGGDRSQEVRGSVGVGLDIRRTVRSVLLGDKSFVKSKAMGFRPQQIREAPIAFLLDVSAGASFSTESVEETKVRGLREQVGTTEYKNADFVRSMYASSDSTVVHS